METPTFKGEYLKVYHKVLAFVEVVYHLTIKVPREEIHEGSSQYTLASVFVPSNITEEASDTVAPFKCSVQMVWDRSKDSMGCSEKAHGPWCY